MDILVVILFAALGAVFGSFAAAQVWRLRAQQLDEDKKAGETVDKEELKRMAPLLVATKLTGDRSRCLACGQGLRWYDLLPIISWLSLGGRCRYCRQPIGLTELITEVALGLAFAASLVFWPDRLDEGLLGVARLLVWLVALVILTINFIYDLRWSLLIAGLNWSLIGCGLLFAGLTVVQAGGSLEIVFSTLGSVGVLGGLYALLWLVSRGRWVGDGDMYLGAGLGLLLGDWRLALVALVMANVIGVLIVIPGMLRGTIKQQSKMPFGPLLIAGFLVAWFVGGFIVNWYQSMLI